MFQAFTTGNGTYWAGNALEMKWRLVSVRRSRLCTNCECVGGGGGGGGFLRSHSDMTYYTLAALPLRGTSQTSSITPRTSRILQADPHVRTRTWARLCPATATAPTWHRASQRGCLLPSLLCRFLLTVPSTCPQTTHKRLPVKAFNLISGTL